MKKLLSFLLITFSIATACCAGDTSFVQKSVNQVTQSISDAGNGVNKTLESVADIPDSAKLSFSKVYDDMKAGIAALASSLKVGAEHVYGVLVMQQVVYAITHILVIIMLLIATIIGYKQAKMTFKSHREIGELEIGKDNMRKWSIDDSVKGILAVVISVITILLSIATVITICCSLQAIIMGLINPEYGAIKDIISIVK